MLQHSIERYKRIQSHVAQNTRCCIASYIESLHTLDHTCTLISTYFLSLRTSLEESNFFKKARRLSKKRKTLEVINHQNFTNLKKSHSILTRACKTSAPEIPVTTSMLPSLCVRRKKKSHHSVHDGRIAIQSCHRWADVNRSS